MARHDFADWPTRSGLCSKTHINRANKEPDAHIDGWSQAGWGAAQVTRATVPSAGRGLGFPARRSGPGIHSLEGEVVEPDRPGEDLAMLVDHGDGVASRQRPAATRGVGVDLVEVDDPEARQWVVEGRYARVTGASDARVDGDGRGEPGIDREIDCLQCGFIGEEEVRRAGRLGVEAQGGADCVARADRQVDLPDTLCLELAGDVLRGVDGHLDVDIDEAETDEGMEVVDWVERTGHEPQVGHRPGDEKGGERRRRADELVAARLDGARAQSCGGDCLLLRRCGVGPCLQMLVVAVAICLSLPQRCHARLGLGIRPQRQPMPYEVLVGCGEWVEVLRWKWVEAQAFPFAGLLFSHDTLLPIGRSWEQQLAQARVPQSALVWIDQCGIFSYIQA